MTRFEVRTRKCHLCTTKKLADFPLRIDIKVATVGELRGLIKWIKDYRSPQGRAGLYGMFLSHGFQSQTEGRRFSFPAFPSLSDCDTLDITVRVGFTSDRPATLFRLCFA